MVVTKEMADRAKKSFLESFLNNGSLVVGAGLGAEGDDYYIRAYLRNKSKKSDNLPENYDGVRVEYVVEGRVLAAENSRKKQSFEERKKSAAYDYMR